MSGRKSTAAGPAPRAQARDKAATRGDEADESLFQAYPSLVALALLVPFAAYLHSRLLPLVADVDSFYHLRHSWVYLTNGLFDSSFPWTQYSVIRTYAADIWYGFHILTLPFATFESLVDGVHWAAFVVTLTSLWLFFAAFRTLEVRWPLLWVFFVPLMSSDLMYRLTMMRPHPLSLGLTVLLFAYLAQDRSRFTLMAVFAIGAFQAWLHLALIWMPVFIAGVIVFVQLLHKRLPDLPRLAVLGAGLVFGALLRPNPIGALRVAYVQIVALMLEKGDFHLLVGVELWPFYSINFFDQSIPATVLTLTAVGVVIWMIRDRRFAAVPTSTRIAMWSSLLIAAVFFTLSFEVARRSHEIFIAFSAVFIALVATQIRGSMRDALPIRVAAALAAVTLAAGSAFALYRYPTLSTETAFDSRRFEEASKWLAQNAKPGEIVFHPRWDMFGYLFFWNPRNYYINGMDPIFEFAYDPSLYWKNHYLHLGAADEMTCAEYPCVDKVVDTYESLKNDFHASYVIFDPAADLTGLQAYFDRTPQFTKVFESRIGELIYRID